MDPGRLRQLDLAVLVGRASLAVAAHLPLADLLRPSRDAEGRRQRIRDTNYREWFAWMRMPELKQVYDLDAVAQNAETKALPSPENLSPPPAFACASPGATSASGARGMVG